VETVVWTLTCCVVKLHQIQRAHLTVAAHCCLVRPTAPVAILHVRIIQWCINLLTSTWPRGHVCDVMLVWRKGNIENLSLCYGIVYCSNGAQRYKQFLQVGWLYWTLNLLGLALYLPSTSVSSDFMALYIYIYIFKNFCLHPSSYLLVSWAWWDWPMMWFTNRRPSVLWRCWFGHINHKIVEWDVKPYYTQWCFRRGGGHGALSRLTVNFLDNFCTVFVSFVSQLNRKIGVPKSLSVFSLCLNLWQNAPKLIILGTKNDFVLRRGPAPLPHATPLDTHVSSSPTYWNPKYATGIITLFYLFLDEAFVCCFYIIIIYNKLPSCSVCLSITFVDSVKTNKRIFKFFFYHRIATPF